MKNLTKKFIIKISCALLVSTIAFSAWAISLDDAKQQGLVGEMSNGYLGLIIDSPDAKSLVTSVNEKRKSIYMNLARTNKITMQQVTALAGKKAYDKTQLGHFIQNSAGQWVKK
ncbi:MAG: hypothetical protein ACJA0T_001237 [Colwellia sp.]|jgi:uncharacterized protein YdbL (DUF1318 family)